MNQEKIGKFIAQLRKEKSLTQKELALKLNITDKAVSKWERGLSCPDITLLPVLADLLGVSIGELLTGQMDHPLEKDTIDQVVKYADQTIKYQISSLYRLLFSFFTGLCCFAIVICILCDLVIDQSLTWSWFPTSSIIFAWFLISPILKYGKKGIMISLIMLTILIFPFFFVLNHLLASVNLFLPIAITMSGIGILFLWSLYFLFRHFSQRKALATVFSLFLVIPTTFLVNLGLGFYIEEPIFDGWDLLSFGLVTLLGIVLLVFFRKKRSLF